MQATSRSGRSARRLAALCLLLSVSACAAGGARDAATGDDAHSVSLRLADATLSAGAASTALHVADELLQRDAGDAPALLRRGRALLALGRPGEAAQSFAAAAAARPASLDALKGLALARAASGDAADAEAAWRRALAIAPDDWRLQTGLAIALDLQERHAEAQALYRTILAHAPDQPAVRSDYGLSMALSGQTASALPLLRQAAQGGSGDALAARARHNLALGLMLAGDEADARNLLAEDLPPSGVSAALAGLRQFAAAQ